MKKEKKYIRFIKQPLFLQEHHRQERLRDEALKLKKQEEEIRRRQEEIAKELMESDISVSSGTAEVAEMMQR